jgi:hypothetical protein
MPFAIGSPANTGAVAQTTESGYFASFLAVPLGGSGGNFDQSPLRQGLNLSPGFPVSFGDFLEIAWFTFHRLCLYGEIYCSYYLRNFAAVKVQRTLSRTSSLSSFVRGWSA